MNLIEKLQSAIDEARARVKQTWCSTARSAR